MMSGLQEEKAQWNKKYQRQFIQKIKKSDFTIRAQAFAGEIKLSN